MLTPICWARLMMFSVPTRCARSVYAVMEDCAKASCPFRGPRLHMQSLLNLNDEGSFLAWSVVDSWSWSCGESGGTHSGLLPFSVLVFTFMPSLTAWDSTYGLNEEPTCSRAYTAVLTWQSDAAHWAVGRFMPGPP